MGSLLSSWVFSFHKLLISHSLLAARLNNSQEGLLSIGLFDKNIDNLIGIGSDFDNSGECVNGLFKLGFGFVEIGPITPQNEKSEKESPFAIQRNKIILKGNKENLGILYTKSLIKSQKPLATPNKIIGINLIPNQKIKDLAPYLCDKDYLFSANAVLDCVDYMVINFSGVNKTNLSHYFEDDHLMKLINLLQRSAKNVTKNKEFPKILVKIDPDLDNHIQRKICNVALGAKLDGIIVGEMLEKRKTNNDDEFIYEFYQNQEMKLIEMQALRFIYKNTNKIIPIISSGNIFSGEEIVERVKNGANAVQITHPFILKGHKFCAELTNETKEILMRSGIKNIMELHGQNVNE